MAKKLTAAVVLLALVYTAIYYGADYIRDQRRSNLADQVLRESAENREQSDSWKQAMERFSGGGDSSGREQEGSTPPLNLDVGEVMRGSSGESSSGEPASEEDQNWTREDGGQQTDSEADSGESGSESEGESGESSGEDSGTIGEMIEQARENAEQVERNAETGNSTDSSQDDGSGSSGSADSSGQQNGSGSDGSGNGTEGSASSGNTGSNSSGTVQSQQNQARTQQQDRDPPEGPYTGPGVVVVPVSGPAQHEFEAGSGRTGQLLFDLTEGLGGSAVDTTLNVGLERTDGGAGWTGLEAWVVSLEHDANGYVTGYSKVNRLFSEERGSNAPPISRSNVRPGRIASTSSAGILFVADNRQNRGSADLSASVR